MTYEAEDPPAEASVADGPRRDDFADLADYPDLVEMAASLDPLDLEDFRALVAVAADKPWLRESVQEMRERLVVGAEVAERLAQRHRDRRRVGTTRVYTVRLDEDEIYALERRAAYLRLPPRALARNLIRAGLRRDSHSDPERLLTELERSVARLREHLA